MKKQKKSRFWTFCLSFIPGAAEMYMGFMKAGLSLMTLFVAICFFAMALNIGPLLFIGCISWFYSFFHARNLASLTVEELEQMEDDYVIDIEAFMSKHMKQEKWNQKWNQKRIAYVLIVIGGYILFHGAFSGLRLVMPDEFYYHVVILEELVLRSVIGLVIVYVGLRMIRGKKSELFREDVHENVDENVYEDEVTQLDVSLLLRDGENDGTNESAEEA